MRRASTAAFALATLIAGYIIGSWASTSFAWSTQGKIWIWITLAGAFGGMLYTFREGGLVCPHSDSTQPHQYNLGWISDCAYGIAGSYVIFLLIPTEIGNSSGGDKSLLEGSAFGQIQLIALALVGGYGGRSLVDRAFANLAKRIEDVQESTERVVAEKETDALALEIVQLHLDEEEEAQPTEKMKTAVSAASRVVRFRIFKQARAVRTENWKTNPPLAARTIPIFEALIDNAAGEVFHRNHAQLGYALKDKGGPGSTSNDLPGAYVQLNKAIHLRDQEAHDLRRADGSPAFLMYEFNRAICAIKLGREKSEIINDLKAASSRDSLRESITTEDIFTTWARENGVNLATLGNNGGFN